MAFDFDEWALLAKQDKAAFEAKRTVTIEQFMVNRARSDRELRKLRGLQFRIDMVRRKHKTPLASCIAIYAMLMEHVYLLAELEAEAAATFPQLKEIENHRHKSGNVIPFKSKG